MIADYNNLCNCRQTLINKNNRRENLRRRFRDYKGEDEILKIVYNPDSLQERAIGPFVIQQVMLMAPSQFSVPTTSTNILTSVAFALIVVRSLQIHREEAECSILVCLSLLFIFSLTHLTPAICSESYS
jgi:hypothetical protein